MQLDALMLAKGLELYQWRGGATPLPMIWRSKEFELPLGVRLGCARVTSDQISQCRFTLIIDDVRVFSLAEGQIPAGVFRLPPLRGRRWQVEVAGTAVIERITLGSSIAEVAAP
jgi:hypothetical protein